MKPENPSEKKSIKMCATMMHPIEEGPEDPEIACISFNIGVCENLKRILFVNKRRKNCTNTIA
jgi:hypothetical protein